VVEAHVSAYLRGDRVVVTSESKTTGFWIANGGFEDLPSSVDDQGLGASIERMLGVSESALAVPFEPLPSESANLDSPTQGALGAAVRRAFSSAA
jgi:hypothetical protein